MNAGLAAAGPERYSFSITNSEQSIRAIALHTSSRMFGLIRFYYGHGYFIYSTESSRGYIRALLVHELEMPGQYDLEPVMAR